MREKKGKEQQPNYRECRNCREVLGGSVLAEEHCREKKHGLERANLASDLRLIGMD